MKKAKFKPRIFIGSSSEAKAVAEKLEAHMIKWADTQLWTKIFYPGDTTIGRLSQELDQSNYAVLIATPVDKVHKRGTKTMAARDNVIFEAGLFMGRLGRDRAFLVCDEGLELPSDLSGLTVVKFNSKSKESIKDVANLISKSIKDMVIEREIDFLRAYLTFIDPKKTKLSDTYSDLIYRHYSSIEVEIEKLRKQKNWERLLAVKERLREYFEYSGEYKKGVIIGEAYVNALNALNRRYEAAWSMIKDIGYLKILDGTYDEGRTAILSVIRKKKSNWFKALKRDDQAKLLFYAYRYLAISYYRDPAKRNCTRAKKCLGKAEETLSLMNKKSDDYRVLKAKYLRNLGRLEEIGSQNINGALSLYRQSLDLFKKMNSPQHDENEHIGISHLAIAEALLTLEKENREGAVPHLRQAELLFTQIGWLEGQARVKEQFARYYCRLAKNEDNMDQAERFLRDAFDHTDVAETMFQRIQSRRFKGKLDPIRQELNRIKSNLNRKRHQSCK